MAHYVGLDVSLKQTSICVVSDTGSVVREGVVDSDPEAIAAFVRPRTSNPSKQHKNDNDNQDDADNADTTMSIAVTVTAEAAAEAAKQKYDEDDKENEFPAT